MPNIATVLKAEVSRIARREVRRESGPGRKAQSTFRADVAALKRRVDALESQLRKIARQPARPVLQRQGEAGPPARVSPKSIASLRRRLGLSAEAFGRLIGTSGQSVYNWEAGKARPRGPNLSKITSLKGVSKKAVGAYLASRAASGG